MLIAKFSKMEIPEYLPATEELFNCLEKEAYHEKIKIHFSDVYDN